MRAASAAAAHAAAVAAVRRHRHGPDGSWPERVATVRPDPSRPPAGGRAAALFTRSAAAAVLASCLWSCGSVGSAAPSGDLGSPPIVEPRPTKLVALPHGHERVDPYYWLSETGNPEVQRYLEAENRYLAESLQHAQDLQHDLLEEMMVRVTKPGTSLPVRHGEFEYYERREEGRERPLYCRRSLRWDGREEVLLDLAPLAHGQPAFALVATAISANHELLAYVVETDGPRTRQIRFRDVGTDRALADVIEDVDGNIAWAADNRTLLYARADLSSQGTCRIYRHVLGNDPREDDIVYEERDAAFSCRVDKTRSGRFLTITSEHPQATEVRFAPADEPERSWVVVEPRRSGHVYRVTDHGEHLYVLTNDAAPNGRVMRTPVVKPGRRNWQTVIPHCDDVVLRGIEAFRDHLVVDEIDRGLPQIRVQSWDGTEVHTVELGEGAVTLRIGENRDYESHVLRLSWSSPTTPPTVLDYDLRKREATILQQEEVIGPLDPADYRCERLFATAQDGAQIPIALVYRRDLERDGTAPLLLLPYGASGIDADYEFRTDRLSLVDRGFVYAIAHVRGGAELGERWRDTGRLLRKKTAFSDFIDTADHLIAERYVDPRRLFAMGREDAGPLLGAVLNMRPQMFHGVVAARPFVDVLTTMLDENLPMATSERSELGNPKDPTTYYYMLSYSPYDNVSEQTYPNLLVTSELHDERIPPFEAAKWVAKLRACTTGGNLLLLHTDMERAHGQVANRFQRLQETALHYSFLVDLAGTPMAAPASRP